jgi:hypothetical protein
MMRGICAKDKANVTKTPLHTPAIATGCNTSHMGMKTLISRGARKNIFANEYYWKRVARCFAQRHRRVIAGTFDRTYPRFTDGVAVAKKWILPPVSSSSSIK